MAATLDAYQISGRTLYRWQQLDRSAGSKVAALTYQAAHPRKPKGFQATYPGQCVGANTIGIQRDGQRRYIRTFTDLHSRFTLAVASTNKSSQRTRVLWRLSKACFPYPVERVLSDNEESSKPRSMWKSRRMKWAAG